MATQNPYADRVLNRKPKYDYRNKRLSDFISPAMRARAATVVNKVWVLDFISDQGDTPHCVGYAWLNYGNCQPIDDEWKNGMGETLYYRAKEFDGEPGAEDGSSTLSGVKSFMQYAQLKDSKYAFVTDIEDMKVWLLDQSPVVVGTNWYNDMFYPDSAGVVHVGGGIAGGHEYMAIGYDRQTDMFLFANSWGTGFGNNGSFSMSAAEFSRLLAEQGDACTAVEVGVEPVPTPTPDPTPTPTPNPTPLPDWVIWLIEKIIEFLKSLLGG